MNIKIFAENLEKAAIDQISSLDNNPAFEDSIVRIMPDCHAGWDCVVGMTASIGNRIQPSIVGVDIGCGVSFKKLSSDKIDFEKLDIVIRRSVPSGFSIRDTPLYETNLNNLACYDKLNNIDRINKSIGTLGGGNHFIEVAEGSTGIYLIVHSGSRNLGHQVATYYDKMAKDGGGYLSGDGGGYYLRDMQFCTQWARQNRLAIINQISKDYQISGMDVEESIHNYIDMEKGILRKGAISALSNQICIIPMNMRDGSLLCLGKGNPDWNYSAPHGSGRILSRNQARKKHTLEEYRESMKGVFTTSVSTETLDECPMAYKDIEYIKRMISPTVEVLDVLKPLYNFKAS